MDIDINLNDEESVSPRTKANQDVIQLGRNEDSPPTNYQNYQQNQYYNQNKNNDAERQQAQFQKQKPSGCCRFFKLQFYEQFFQASQGQVVQRIKLAFVPVKNQFIEKVGSNPDFYGPFWILTTIIFLLSSTANLSRYFYNFTKDDYLFKLQLVRVAVVIVYLFGFGWPSILYFIMKFMGLERLKLPDIICIYGYSFSCFILIFILCVIPVSGLQWLLMAYGMINTTAFLVLNLKDYLTQLQKPKIYVLFGLMAVVEIVLFLIFKLYFFDMIYVQPN